jgi:CRISPR-associated exonuclease Cas4
MLLESPEKITEFAKVSEILMEAQNLLNQPPQIRELEKKLLKTLKETMPSTVNVKIGIQVPNIPELVQRGTFLLLNDGIETSVESKGHGLQRALILAMFRIFAEFLKSTTPTKPKIPSFIFAIEEPELYLHPQCQRIMFETLENISEIDQIIFCTHSTFFIDMSHYNSLLVVSKPELSKTTEIYQCVREIFPPEEKNYFKMINEFDPERNEVFFARKVVLVEGDSEKVAFPRICRIMGVSLNSKGISIVECGSKFNMPFFMRVLNAFKIPYVVIHDEDPVDPNLTGDKLDDAMKIFNENSKIQSVLKPAFGKIEILQPDFDSILELSKHQVELKGKPYAVFLKLQQTSEEQIPERLRRIITELL